MPFPRLIVQSEHKLETFELFSHISFMTHLTVCGLVPSQLFLYINKLYLRIRIEYGRYRFMGYLFFVMLLEIVVLTLN